MAARKKKAKVKKKAAKKSTASKSVSRKKAAPKKKKAAKKKSVPTRKKKAAGKKVSKKASSTGSSAKKTKKSKKKTSGTSSARGKSSIAPEKPVKQARQKLSMGKSKKIGSRVKTLTGREVGATGVIVRQDASLGTFFILLDSKQQDQVYKKIEWGPYFESQLEFLKKR